MIFRNPKKIFVESYFSELISLSNMKSSRHINAQFGWAIKQRLYDRALTYNATKVVANQTLYRLLALSVKKRERNTIEFLIQQGARLSQLAPCRFTIDDYIYLRLNCTDIIHADTLNRLMRNIEDRCSYWSGSFGVLYKKLYDNNITLDGSMCWRHLSFLNFDDVVLYVKREPEYFKRHYPDVEVWCLSIDPKILELIAGLDSVG